MNFQLYNDKVWTLPLKPTNAAGVAQPWAFGANVVAVSSNPASLGAVAQAVGGSNPTLWNLILTPKVQMSPGLTVTVSNPGMASVVFGVDIVPDPALLTVAVDIVPADVVTAPQAIPAATGP